MKICLVCEKEFLANTPSRKCCSRQCSKTRHVMQLKKHNKIYSIIHKEELRAYHREYLKRPEIREKKIAYQRERRLRISEKNKEIRICAMCDGPFECQKSQHIWCCSPYCSQIRNRKISNITNSERRYKHIKRSKIALKSLKSIGVYIPVANVRNRSERHRIRRKIALRACKELGININI